MYLSHVSSTNHYFIKCLYEKHAQHSLRTCNFAFKGWRLWWCPILWVKHLVNRLSRGVFFLECCALAHKQPSTYKSKPIFFKDGDAAYLWGQLLFFEEYHLFKALLAGDVAQVEDSIDGIDYFNLFHLIPLWTIAVLCNSNYKSFVHLTWHVLPQPIRISFQLRRIARWQGIGVIPPGYKHDISIRMCGGLMALHQG